MIITSIDIVKQTYIPAFFPSSFFLFYNGKHPKNFRLHLCQHQANFSHFFFFTKINQMSLTFALCLDHAAFCFSKIHNNIINCVYSKFILTGVGTWVSKPSYLATDPITIQEGQWEIAQAITECQIKVRGPGHPIVSIDPQPFRFDYPGDPP